MTYRQEKRQAAITGERLALWLNGAPQAPREKNGNKTRVAKLVRLLTELDAEIAGTSGPLSHNDRIRELEAKVSKRMKRYRTSPRFACDFGTARIVPVHIWQGGAGLEESEALRYIEQLLNAGKLVARCDWCQKWFYRNRRSDRFCSKACRIANDEAKPSRRERKNRSEYRNYWTKEYRYWLVQSEELTGKLKEAAIRRLKKANQKRNEAERRLKEIA